MGFVVKGQGSNWIYESTEKVKVVIGDGHEKQLPIFVQ
jgi:hypothetical protein